jgi:hypothetical protein
MVTYTIEIALHLDRSVFSFVSLTMKKRNVTSTNKSIPLQSQKTNEQYDRCSDIRCQTKAFLLLQSLTLIEHN